MVMIKLLWAGALTTIALQMLIIAWVAVCYIKHRRHES